MDETGVGIGKAWCWLGVAEPDGGLRNREGRRVIAEGWHAKFGGPHAKRCTGSGRDPGRKEQLYSESGAMFPFLAKLRLARMPLSPTSWRVVVAMKDPNPKVAGRGIEKIRAAGIEVEVGLMETEARVLNRSFLHYITEKSRIAL